MDSLELVRKLYDEKVEPEVLGEKLDEHSREELKRLVEAKEALDALPRHRPGIGVVDAVVNSARLQNAPASGLTLLISSARFQRLVAAAVVVVTVGVGYFALRTPEFRSNLAEQAAVTTEGSTAPSQEAAQEALASEVEEERQDNKARQLGDEGAETGGRAVRAREAEPASPAPVEEMRKSLAENRREAKIEAPADAPDLPARDDADAFLAADMALDEVGMLADSMAERDAGTSETRDLLSWDDEEEALRTFFWQVRALDRRSPDEEWEEAVPLEGSFERLEKQQPADKHWMQTGSQR